MLSARSTRPRVLDVGEELLVRNSAESATRARAMRVKEFMPSSGMLLFFDRRPVGASVSSRWACLTLSPLILSLPVSAACAELVAGVSIALEAQAQHHVVDPNLAWSFHFGIGHPGRR